MRRLPALTALVLGAATACSTPALASGPSVKSALPPGSHLIAQVALPGYRHAEAVAFDSGRSRIGVVAMSSGRARLTWSHALPSAPRRLAAPGPTGVFLVVAGQQPATRTLSAYRLHMGQVSWALDVGKGNPIAARSVHIRKTEITIVNPDTAHMGSVKYKLTTQFSWSSPLYHSEPPVRSPDYAPQDYPVPNGVVVTSAGDTVLMKLETAWTLAQQEHGLMDRSSLDPDSGMVFVWPELVDYSFYMANTLIPLSIAFLAPDGTILDVQDMAALDATTLHSPDSTRCATQVPGQCYQYAIEMNKGFFAQNGIQIGDKVRLSLPCSTFGGFHSASVKCYS